MIRLYTKFIRISSEFHVSLITPDIISSIIPQQSGRISPSTINQNNKIQIIRRRDKCVYANKVVHETVYTKSDDLVRSAATTAIYTRRRRRQQSGTAACRLRLASLVYLRTALMIKRSRLCRIFTSAVEAAYAVDSFAEQNTGIWKM